MREAEVSPATEGLMSVDLVLKMIELLAACGRPRGLSDIAGELGISKARAHRHLRSLLTRGYARQCPETERYEIGIKLLLLGESVRERFDVLTAARPEMMRLRDESGQAVTISALVEDAVTVLDMLQGKTIMEFGLRAGARLDFHASAHGRIALAFGPETLLAKAMAEPLRAWTSATVTDPEALSVDIEQVRRQGWSTAADQLLLGVNALAAPIFDHHNRLQGAIAIVGSSQFIADRPSETQIGEVMRAARSASCRLGWRQGQP